MLALTLRFLKNETAATAIEYTIISAGIALAIVAAVNALGTQVSSTYSSVSTNLK